MRKLVNIAVGLTDLVIADAKFILVGMFDRFRFKTSRLYF